MRYHNSYINVWTTTKQIDKLSRLGHELMFQFGLIALQSFMLNKFVCDCLCVCIVRCCMISSRSFFFFMIDKKIGLN